MSTRTDIHRPSAPEFDPEAYELVDVFDLNPGWPGDGGHRIRTVNRMLDQGYRFAGSTVGGCGHCGARIRYAALMTHRNGRDMLYVGEICLENRFFDMTAARFQELRKAAALNRERVATADRIADLVEDHPLLAELTYPQIEDWAGGFVSDVAYKFRRDGRLSERQIEAVESAILREIEYRERDAQRAAEEAAATPVPVTDERITVEGVVLTTKWQDSDYGYGGMKMLIKTDAGWKVWGSVPSSIDPVKGNRVSFAAYVSVSDDDPYFGFFRLRQRKAKII